MPSVNWVAFRGISQIKEHLELVGTMPGEKSDWGTTGALFW